MLDGHSPPRKSLGGGEAKDRLLTGSSSCLALSVVACERVGAGERRAADADPVGWCGDQGGGRREGVQGSSYAASEASGCHVRRCSSIQPTKRMHASRTHQVFGSRRDVVARWRHRSRRRPQPLGRRRGCKLPMWAVRYAHDGAVMSADQREMQVQNFQTVFDAFVSRASYAAISLLPHVISGENRVCKDKRTCRQWRTWG